MLDALPTAHHQLLGHGLAVAALRGRTTSPIAIANNYSPVRRRSGRATDADRAAGGRATTRCTTGCTSTRCSAWATRTGFELPVRDGDLAIISAPIDALGVNYYNPTGISAPSDADFRCRSTWCRWPGTR